IEMMVGAADAAAVIDATHDAEPASDTVEAVAPTEVDRPGSTFLEVVAAAAAAAHHEPHSDQAAGTVGDLEPEVEAAVAEPDLPEAGVAAQHEAVSIPVAAEMEPDVEPETEPVAAGEPVAGPMPVEPATR